MLQITGKFPSLKESGGHLKRKLSQNNRAYLFLFFVKKASGVKLFLVSRCPKWPKKAQSLKNGCHGSFNLRYLGHFGSLCAPSWALRPRVSLLAITEIKVSSRA